MAVRVVLIFVLCLSLAASACGSHDVTIKYFGGYTFSRAEHVAIQRIADATASEVRRLLPALPRNLVLRAQAGTDVMVETGMAASALPPDMVVWTIDPGRPGGVLGIVNAQLRACLFHEFHHLVRLATKNPMTLMDHVVTEGMATAFERDFAGAQPPWGEYPREVSDWVAELFALPATAPRNEWLHRHPDGRRWIGYKVGTYLVDEAMRRSGRTSGTLSADRRSLTGTFAGASCSGTWSGARQ